jgi:hypothetical protein
MFSVSSMFSVSPGRPFWLPVVAAAFFVLVGILWLVLGATSVLKGDDVDKPNRIAQLYGYTVCLIALIVSLISVSSILDAAFERANPLQAEISFGAALTSFEAYRATYRREREVFDRTGSAQPDTVSEATLRRRYDALVADRLASVRYRTSKTFTTHGVLLLICLGLFVFHWRWVRRLNGTGGAAA